MSSTKKEKQSNERTAQRVLLWTCIIVVLGGIVWAAVSSTKKSGESSEKRSIDTSRVDEKDWMKGNRDAKLTLVEYSDFQCPACAAYHPVVRKVAYEMGGRVKIVYRHYPLKSTHKNAESASRAAEAAGVQGKFWEMHDMLFEKQSEWSPLGDPKPTFDEYAKSLQLNVEKFSQDMASSQVQAKIDSDVKSADKASVNATPTFFLNGKKLDQPQGYDGLKNSINEASGE
ncbi:DsbA family protein [Candidatus Uhrbacteria bacterium]|nr:DsbA family protein [Candidatus Uhrbacteria bacterium]